MSTKTPWAYCTKLLKVIKKLPKYRGSFVNSIEKNIKFIIGIEIMARVYAHFLKQCAAITVRESIAKSLISKRIVDLFKITFFDRLIAIINVYAGSVNKLVCALR